MKMIKKISLLTISMAMIGTSSNIEAKVNGGPSLSWGCSATSNCFEVGLGIYGTVTCYGFWSCYPGNNKVTCDGVMQECNNGEPMF